VSALAEPPAARRPLLSACPSEYMLEMPPDLCAVRVARAALRAALENARLLPLIDDALSIASELVTNALLYGPQAGEVHMWLKLWARHLEIHVTDADPQPPLPKDPRPFDESGRGLLMVDTLAQTWGWQPMGRYGKLVWARLEVSA
jgi:anti-sigma regulatory factor (Ser/Thr protein kinase)